jgi:hypothetical protein
MPHFCEHCDRVRGAASDTWICQKCGEVFCSNPKCFKYRRAIWVSDLIKFRNNDGTTGTAGGNVCVECFTEGTQRSY